MTADTSHFTLRRIEVANFKRFAQAEFELRPLTLLVGLNGSGKSTLVQALLLGMRGLYARYDGFIALNQPGFALGQAEDVFTLGETQSDRIEIGLTFANGKPPWPVVFERHPDPLRLAVKSGAANALVREQLRPSMGPEWVSYLSAERLGPRISLPVSAQGESAVYVGAQGELTADCLLNNLNHKVSPGRQFPTASPDEDALITLPKQAEQWMTAMVPGLQVKPIRRTEVLQSTLQFGTRELGSEWVRPTNMGFGVSYALPIIVQGLLTAKGGILIVENPEAHLHPAGQSAMGRFLALCAADGVQVIVETHSDHVLNGICLAVLEDKHPLRREDVLIHSFLNEPHEGKQVLAIEIDKRGGFTQNPPGFFDQSAKDLQAILRARRPEAQTAKKLLERAKPAEE